MPCPFYNAHTGQQENCGSVFGFNLSLTDPSSSQYVVSGTEACNVAFINPGSGEYTGVDFIQDSGEPMTNQNDEDVLEGLSITDKNGTSHTIQKDPVTALYYVMVGGERIYILVWNFQAEDSFSYNSAILKSNDNSISDTLSYDYEPWP